MTTLDDLLTAQKNGVVAINNLGQTYTNTLAKMSYLAGESTTLKISGSTTVVASGGGRLVRVSVIDAGSTAGTIYAGSVSAANAICSIPMTIGVYEIGAQFSGALNVVPGTGQSVSVTYSLD